jgi:hypothetical protein
MEMLLFLFLVPGRRPITSDSSKRDLSWQLHKEKYYIVSSLRHEIDICSTHISQLVTNIMK